MDSHKDPDLDSKDSGAEDGRSLIRGFREWLATLLSGRNGEDSMRETIEDLLDERGESGEPMDPDESALLVNILKLHKLTVDDVMVPRAEIVAVDADISLDALVKAMMAASHSRLPLYRESRDNVIGFVHIKDVLAAVATVDDPKQAGIGSLRRDILFAAPSMKVLDLMLEMRIERTHMAIIVDEFGGVDGLVTIEDLVEEIVGEIEDEHDAAGPTIVRTPDGKGFVADARVRVDEFEAEAGPFATEEEREEIETLGGIVFGLLGRVPRRAEIVRHPSGLEFEIIDADPRRVKRLGIRWTEQAENRTSATHGAG